MQTFATIGRRPTRALLVACAVAVLSAACRLTPVAERPLSLAGPWKFQPGDDLRRADAAYDDRGWAELQVPRSWGRQGFADVYGMAWYRTRVVPRWPADEPLALVLGKIDSAYEVYAGGQRLGGVGTLPPQPSMEYDRHRIYTVPSALREPDGGIVIALRVWRANGKSAGAAGPVEGPFEIGPVAAVVQRETLAEAAQLGLVLLFLAAAAFHLGLRLLRPEAPAYGWFGLMALESAIYAVLRTQWKYMVFDDFILLKKVEHLMIYLVPPTFLQFLWVFFERPVPRVIRVLQVLGVAAGVIICVLPGLDAALAVLPAGQATVFLAAAAGVIFVLPFIRAGDPEARLLGAGALAIVVTVGSDFFVERNFYVAPRTVVYGFGVLVSGMSLALANRFHRVLGEVDHLRRDLEERVDARTKELSAAYAQMEALALRDGLTGLLNRRALLERAHADLARARRHRTSFALALIDVDHFKTVNDTHGHAIGDQVLERVGRLLGAGLRVSDAVGRWGGEEFLVLLPEADTREALAAAERLRLQVAEAVLRIDARPIVVTVSVGVAVADRDRIDTAAIEDLIRDADAALYRAKAQGRNQVVGAA